MRSYLVGGAVRDQMLGRSVQDQDFVVVGATPEEMIAAGYTPVGRDFPVFLHPETHAEYALARTERKTAPGYRGFVVHAAPSVTLEEDLARRDLTINAMAMDADGTLIDPCGGAADLEAGILRHVSPAFVEDPVRILRVARFAARLGFRVAPETAALMCRMVAAGEVDALVPERVWAEFSRGLMAAAPAAMLDVLMTCGALSRIIGRPELQALPLTGLARLDRAAADGSPLPLRFALLVLDVLRAEGQDASEQALRALCLRLRAPNDCRDLALLGAKLATPVQAVSDSTSAETLLSLIERADALRQRDRFIQLLALCRRLADAEATAFPPATCLTAALDTALSVDAGAVARNCANPAEIAQRVRAARLEALRAAG